MKRNKTVQYYSVLIFWMNVSMCMCVCFVHKPTVILRNVCFYFLRKNWIYILSPPLQRETRDIQRETYTLILNGTSKHTLEEERGSQIVIVIYININQQLRLCYKLHIYIYNMFFFSFFQVFIKTFFHLYLFSLVFPIYKLLLNN